MELKRKAETYLADTIGYRRHLHQNPELSGQEAQTALFVRRHLESWGIPYREIQGNGVLGVIDSSRPGKTVALRADMDALAVPDQTEAAYASENPGVSHACGHDCHTASLLTAARILAVSKEAFSGKIHLIFQPSEEGPPGGAWQMIENGAMEGVDGIFGIHMLNSIDVGKVSVQSGPRMAASMRVYLDVIGKGGHGGMPHECIDPVVAASAIVMNLQTIASRELNMLDSAVVTVGVFHGGEAFNAVSPKVHMEATVKYFNYRLKDQIMAAIKRIAENTAAAFGAQCHTHIEGHCPPVVNDLGLSQLAQRSAERLFGPGSVVECPPYSGSEDFAKYLEHAKGVFAFIGGRNLEKLPAYPLHHPMFNIDESALAVASALYAQLAIDFLSLSGE